MRTLVVGYGSIGARHARILETQGHTVHCVTKNTECPFPSTPQLGDALDFAPELIVISNRTADHAATLATLNAADYSGLILVEKPLFSAIPPSLPQNTDALFVAYNLRFHPIVKRASALLKGKTIYSAQFNVGQYLPNWRPGTDYTESYSAHKDQGGGVLRDLSHELDLALHLTGPWQRVTALGGHFSPLAITSDDVFSILMESRDCPAVMIHMDYLNRTPHRGFDINAEGLSLHADFIAKRIEINGEIETFQVDRDTTYEMQLKALISGNVQTHCTFHQGMAVMSLIEAIEKSASDRTWIETI